ncbi:MAG: exo-alpha-sialidase [Vicinamibacterales bacterium]
MRNRLIVGTLTLALAALIAPLSTTRLGFDPDRAFEHEEDGGEELPPALTRKFAAMATFSPGAATLLEEAAGGTGGQDWLEHATPGTDIPYSAFAGARGDWLNLKARPAVGGGAWTPLGPVYGKGADNPYRDRSVYNSGTDNFSGRSIAGVIDPHCVAGDCRLWVANANGGVWMTSDALAAEPAWEFVSQTFEHNNVAALELDSNDPSANTIWAGTGEPNACGSGCTAGVGLYRTTNGGKSWQGPIGTAAFAGRAVGSIAVQPGNPNVVFAASGRGVLGVSNTCCGGVDALIPGAPHFGLYRSLDGGRNWTIVSQGAANLCTSATPDQVALNQTACSPRGARRVMFDPVDPNTVYVSFLSRGIWRSRDLGDTWEQILPLLGSGTAERAEFDVVQLGGDTRMYVGVGGGGLTAQFRRNDAVRIAAGAAVQASWIVLSSTSLANPAGFSSVAYCDGQCSYDNYVHVPAGAGPDTVYLGGSYQYNENNFVSGRSNGRGILLSTNAGAHFTDMTEDASDDFYPVQAHPDHHFMVTNPANWRQFFDMGDGGIIRSNGAFVDDSGDCSAVKLITNAQRLTLCQMVLARIPERLEPINKGLRTLHFYQIEYNKANPDIIAGGTQDNGSWETLGGDTWLNTNIADGGHNAFDALGGNPDFRMTAWQQGQIEVSFTPQNQTDVTWVSDTMFVFYGGEGVPFIGNAITDPVVPGRLWHGREHVFRAGNNGLNSAFPRADVLAACNVWTGSGDIDGNGIYEPTIDICDDFKPLGDPGTDGRLTAPVWGDRAGGHVSVVERGNSDTSTLWVATSLGRVFVSKNADDATPVNVQFTRLDSLSSAAPPRYPTSIFVDPANANHAWITYSGFNAKTPATPGHVFEVTYDPTSGAVTFANLDGNRNNGFGDIPATSVVVSSKGTLYVGTDFGVVQKQKNSPVWHQPAAGLPNVTVADLVLVPERGVLYAGTHGQGVWQLKVH